MFTKAFLLILKLTNLRKIAYLLKNVKGILKFSGRQGREGERLQLSLRTLLSNFVTPGDLYTLSAAQFSYL